MKPVLLNTYDWGGAGIATTRILDSLRKVGLDAKMLVQHRRHDHDHVIGPGSYLRRAYSAARIVTDSLPIKPYRDVVGNFSFGWMPDDVNRQIRRLDPDIIHLNWVGEGFMNVKSIGRISAPIVWRLPDMWAFTGGCHYSGECRKYEDRCGACPRLGSNHDFDVTRWTWHRKASSWKEKDINVVAPSTWLAHAAGRSSLFENAPIHVIPNALDTAVFQPLDSNVARQRLNLPVDKDLVLFGAQYATSDPRKGFALLQESLRILSENYTDTDIELVVFGGSEPADAPDFGFPTRYLGYLEEESRLSHLYSAADVMVVPSKYEGFGQTVSEALSCGTPVVTFDATGPSDIVDHLETGYLATPYEPADLAEGIRWVLADATRRRRLGSTGRERAIERYSMEAVGHQYRALYEDIISES